MFLTAKNVNTHYQIIGKGKPLILLHGWGCDWQIWANLIPKLSKSFQLIIPDLPAFGKSSKPTSVWDSFQYADWLTDFLQQVVKDEQFYLLGHSFGGKIACIFAANNSKLKLEKLFIVDSSGLPDQLPTHLSAQKKFLQSIPTSIKNLVPTKLKLKLITSTGSSTDYFNATSYQKKVLQKILSEFIAEQLQQFTVPTTIIWGANDQDTPLHQGKAFHKLIEGSNFIVFSKSGHFPFIDETNKFIETIEDEL